MNDFLNFGKYRHLTFLEVIKTDEDYVIWCSTFSDCSPAMQKLNRYYKSYLSQSQSLWGYHLLLEDGNHYVGISKNWPKRISDHMRGKGSAWTRLHPVVNVQGRWKIKHSKLWEKSKTLEVMKKYGWSKVRGYCWCQRNLTKPPAELTFYNE